VFYCVPPNWGVASESMTPRLAPADHEMTDAVTHVWAAHANGHEVHLTTYDGHLSLYALPYLDHGICGVQLVDEHGLIYRQDLGLAT
jgi:hypothetical protein